MPGITRSQTSFEEWLLILERHQENCALKTDPMIRTVSFSRRPQVFGPLLLESFTLEYAGLEPTLTQVKDLRGVYNIRLQKGSILIEDNGGRLTLHVCISNDRLTTQPIPVLC